MIKSLLTEYGISWIFNRFLYVLKLKLMRYLPFTERLFEKSINIKQVDLFDINVKEIEKFLYKLPNNEKEKIISIAKNAINGKIRAFSSLELDYGSPINWQLNPITKKEVDKNTKWYKVSDFDLERGDIKVIWEISRLTHFYFFSRAYMLTKDIKYYEAFSSQLNDWLEKNKYAYGANYKCGQEATLRMINALMAYSVFREYNMISRQDSINIEALVEGSYKKIRSNFFYAYRCVKNNHTLSEITGVIIGAWCCKKENTVKKAFNLLESEIENQFLSDGGYRQYSFNYQRFALQLMEIILKISSKIDCDLSPKSRDLLKKSTLLMYQAQDKSGDVPNYGSNDGALIFPVTSCKYRDFRPVINTLHSLLCEECLYETGLYDEELLWFQNKISNNLSINNRLKRSCSFNNSGFYIFRHLEGHLVTVLQDFTSRPAQMDQMHIDLWHKEVNVLCDSGTFSYANDIGRRMALTSAHNTAKVYGKEQMNKRDPFLIYNWTKAKNITFDEKYFKGTMFSKNGYTHFRKITKNSYGYLIEDIVNSEEKKVLFYFHTPCDIKIKLNSIELSYRGNVLCEIITDNSFVIDDTYRSLYYLQKEKIGRIAIIGQDSKKIKTIIKLK